MDRVVKATVVVRHHVPASRKVSLGDVQAETDLCKPQSAIDVAPEKIGTGQLVDPGHTGYVITHEADMGVSVTRLWTQ